MQIEEFLKILGWSMLIQVMWRLLYSIVIGGAIHPVASFLFAMWITVSVIKVIQAEQRLNKKFKFVSKLFLTPIYPLIYKD